jgi:DNA replication protein DnaC
MELCAALFIENYRRYQGFAKTQFIISPEIIDRHFNYKLGRNMVRLRTHPTVGDGYQIHFAPCSLLVQELLVAKRDLRLTKTIKNLSKFEALILDDIRYVQQTREEMEVLFTLLAERYERGSVMITSNLPFSKWEILFKDPMTTAAAIDRQ